MIRKYEVVYLTKASVTDDKLVTEVDRVLVAETGKIEASEDWGQLKLSYPIKKETEAKFFVRIVATEPSNILNFKKLPHLKKDVLRVWVINTEKEKSYQVSTTLSKLKITADEFRYQITRGRRGFRKMKVEDPKEGGSGSTTND